MAARFPGFIILFVGLTACPAGQGDSGGGGQGGEGGKADGGEPGQGGDTFTTNDTSTATSAMTGCPENCANVDFDQCEQVVCNEDTHECEVGPLADDEPCDDGLFCTDGDTCQGGACEAGPARDCGASTGCGDATCDEAAGECSFEPAPNGTACVPEDLCAEPDGVCVNGTCTAAPRDCSGILVAPECSVGVCDPADGSCDVMPANDGAGCTIGGDICESNKSCAAGACVGTDIPGCTNCNESEANDSIATADAGATCTGWSGRIGVAGDKDFFRVDVTAAGSRILAEITDVTGSGCPAGFTPVLRLLNSAGTEIATDFVDGNASCSAFKTTDDGAINLAVGTYYLTVEENGNDATSLQYLLNVNLDAPFCGDGRIQGTEECDDGNTTSQDGCSASCTFDCPAGQTLVTKQATGLPAAITNGAPLIKDVGVASASTVNLVTAIVDITHTNDADLDITLDAPGAPVVILSDDNGTVFDNYQMTAFSSTATTAITAGTPPFHGWFRPEGSFGNIVGTSASGTWRLTVTDDTAGNDGQLRAFKLALCVTP